MPARLGAVLRRLVPLVPIVAGLTLAACGSDDGGAEGGSVSGRDIAQDNGCMGCHREDGGGIGPDWDGLYGSTVTLDDGSRVVADEEYLALAITDPGAQVVDGFDVQMPANDVSDEDVAAIVDYITSLADTPEATS